MDKLIISETDRGRYAVRPMNWAGIWNEKGQIKESLNHLALFIEKEDAEKFVEWKEAEEQNRLLKLPCAVGDTVYTACSWGIESGIVGSIEIISDRIFVNNTRGQMIGEARNIFLTREEAEAALEELERGKGE